MWVCLKMLPKKNTKFNEQHHDQASDFRVVSYHVFVMQVIAGNLSAIPGYIATKVKPDLGPVPTRMTASRAYLTPEGTTNT